MTNKSETPAAGDNSNQRLKSFIERIERLTEEAKAITDDRKDVYAEAKDAGYDTKILRRVIKIRAQDRNKWQEEEAILDTYLAALGLL